MKIRVLLVDDFPLVRSGIAAALQDEAGIDVVGEAGTAAEAMALAVAQAPDVVLLDLGLPDESGVTMISRLAEKSPRSRVVVITASENVEVLSSAMAAGAVGYLTKRTTPRQLCDAVVTVHGGGTVVDAGLAAVTRPALTERERRVVQLVAEGLTDKEIASALFVSPRTVQNQLTSIRRKLGLGRRSELAHWAATHLGA
ncbi:MAG TPA: response regulator transcription factor [Thermoleophilaceae bacterium]|nr:response regulator transcription factor [Thermoleophilaceae bacterium]